MFGLFGPSTKDKGVEGAYQAAQPFIAMIQHIGAGMPGGFWRDAYILGFLTIIILMGAKQATNGKATGATLGFIQAEVFQRLSNLNGAAIAQSITQLSLSEDKEFNRGGDDGAAVFLYATKSLRDEYNHPLVVTCGGDHGTFPDRALVSGRMVQATLFKRVQELAINA